MFVRSFLSRACFCASMPKNLHVAFSKTTLLLSVLGTISCTVALSIPSVTRHWQTSTNIDFMYLRLCFLDDFLTKVANEDMQNGMRLVYSYSLSLILEMSSLHPDVIYSLPQFAWQERQVNIQQFLATRLCCYSMSIPPFLAHICIRTIGKRRAFHFWSLWKLVFWVAACRKPVLLLWVGLMPDCVETMTITYLPQIGFLIMIPMDEDLPQELPDLTYHVRGGGACFHVLTTKWCCVFENIHLQRDKTKFVSMRRADQMQSNGPFLRSLAIFNIELEPFCCSLTHVGLANMFWKLANFVVVRKWYYLTKARCFIRW